MTTKMRSLRNFRNPIGCLILLAAFAVAAGCSTAESPNGSGTNMNHVLPSGASVAGWLVVAPSGGSHASTATLDYVANGGGSGCTECHGSDLKGGISGVSCFANPAGCHHNPIAVPNWATPAGHGATAKKAPGSSGFASCQICHGNDFSGGGSNVSCFPCHGPNAPHPARPWRGPAYTHTDTDTSNATICARCHFPLSPNNPANHPSAPAPAGTAPGCFNSTLCHGEGGVAHAVPFNDPDHYGVDNAAFATSCGACHAVSAPSVGPACQTCHVAASPLAAVNCTSCHANPPDNTAPAGAAYPNLAGAHAKHLALAILPGGTNVVTCDTCHTGLGPSLLNLNHYNRAKSRVPPGDVAFPAGFLYTGITGTGVTFDNALATLTCSNVSCHGALGTPNWRTGATTCTSCHNSATAPPAFYTDYTQAFFTHNTHVNRTACTTCHTALPAATHFGTLGDKAIASRAAAATINPNFAYPSPPPATLSMNNCNTNSVGGCH